jgi:hypothetical protein
MMNESDTLSERGQLLNLNWIRNEGLNKNCRRICWCVRNCRTIFTLLFHIRFISPLFVDESAAVARILHIFMTQLPVSWVWRCKSFLIFFFSCGSIGNRNVIGMCRQRSANQFALDLAVSF